MTILDKAYDWGRRRGLKDIEDKIHKSAKQNRLVFISKDKIKYVDKVGGTSECTIDEMADKLIQSGGWQKQVGTLGIFKQDIIDILYKEYHKQGGK